jgi:hypothetical protein
LLQRGVSLSGSSVPALQNFGSAVMLYLFGLSRPAGTAPQPNEGTVSYTTSYSAAQYLDLSQRASQYDYTLEELQRDGALFWSWILAGKPPIPPAP